MIIRPLLRQLEADRNPELAMSTTHLARIGTKLSRNDVLITIQRPCSKALFFGRGLDPTRSRMDLR